MRALWVFHFPVYGGPHNTAVGVRGALADLGWETLAALTDEPGNAGQRLTDEGLETVTMPLHRLRASWHPRDNLRTAAGFRREVRALEQLIRARSCDVVVLTGLMNASRGDRGATGGRARRLAGPRHPNTADPTFGGDDPGAPMGRLGDVHRAGRRGAPCGQTAIE